MAHRIVNQAKVRLNHAIRRALGLSRGYAFSPAASIKEQWITFDAGHGPLAIRSDGKMPLYDTIAEVVDGDCYQVRRLITGATSRNLIIDIGANVGIFSIYVAQTYPGQVIAIEPIPGNVARLRANLEANGITNVTVMPVAAAGHDGELELYVDEVSVGAHVSSPEERRRGQNVATFPAVGLGTLLRQRADQTIDLIKMDCEGAEYGILESVTASEVRNVRHLSLEVHDLDRERNLRALQERVEHLGYRTRTAPDWFGRKHLNHLVAFRA